MIVPTLGVGTIMILSRKLAGVAFSLMNTQEE
jgi:hypothetical protein